jgi:acetoacetyl-CoA synthetase
MTDTRLPDKSRYFARAAQRPENLPRQLVYRMFFHTSCAWMMWNWQLSALATGVELVLYDGPLNSVETLWAMVASENVTVFGTTAVYLKRCQDAGLIPGRNSNLNALRAVLSTGSTLYDHQYHWLRDKVKPVPLQSNASSPRLRSSFSPLPSFSPIAQ